MARKACASPRGFAPTEPAFGTILKPTAGITPDEVGALVAEAAACPLFLFIKEDEDLYPNLDYSPVRDRVRRAVAAIEQGAVATAGQGPDLRRTRDRHASRAAGYGAGPPSKPAPRA